MTLFSWFIDNTKGDIDKNNLELAQQKTITFDKSAMWPTAKARHNTVVKQQEYINGAVQMSSNSNIALNEQQN